LIGKIVNAIMASVQPKECSVRSLKNYVTQFYTDFQVEEKPYKFKLALERAVQKDLIRYWLHSVVTSNSSRAIQL